MLTFLALLAAGAAVPVVLFSSLELIGLTGLSPISLASGQHPMRRAASGVWSVAQTYIWLGWAAYCASLGLGYAFNPTAGSSLWVYITVSLIATSLPIAYLRVQDRLSGGSDVDDGSLVSGSHFWKIVVLSSCICFWVAPNLMSTPYGWLSPVAPRVLGNQPVDPVRVLGADPARTTAAAPLPQTANRQPQAVTRVSLGAPAGAPAAVPIARAGAPCIDEDATGTEQNQHDGRGEPRPACSGERSNEAATND